MTALCSLLSLGAPTHPKAPIAMMPHYQPAPINMHQAWFNNSEDKLKQCAPQKDQMWLFGTEHKTGTGLQGTFFAAVHKCGGPDMIDITGDGWMVGKHGQKARESGHKMMTNYKESDALSKGFLEIVAKNGGVMKADSMMYHFEHAKGHAYDGLDEYEKSGGWRKPKLSYMVRNPIDVMVSAYFYHKGEDGKTGPEPWTNDVYCKNSDPYICNVKKSIAMACQDGYHHGEWPIPDPAVCAQDVVKKAASMSYTQLLNSVPDEIAIMIEAVRSYPEVKGMMEAAWEVVKDPRGKVFSLTDAMAGMSSCKNKVAYPQFAHLGLPQKYMKDCAEIYCKSVVAGENGAHSTHFAAASSKDKMKAHLEQSEWLHKTLSGAQGFKVPK